jgi:hypothetical protein
LSSLFESVEDIGRFPLAEVGYIMKVTADYDEIRPDGESIGSLLKFGGGGGELGRK